MKKLIWLSVLGIGSFISYHGQAQKLANVPKQTKPMILGAEIGQQYSFDSHINLGGIHCGHCYTSGMYLKKYINEKLALETSIDYTTNRLSKAAKFKYRQVQVPVTIQYYLLSPKLKLQPYLGLGAVYANESMTTYSTTAFTDGAKINSTNKKQAYASVAVTQGMVYRVSPKIEIKESIHFIPKSKNCQNNISLDLGVGYKL